jgi:hypothetical protein
MYSTLLHLHFTQPASLNINLNVHPHDLLFPLPQLPHTHKINEQIIHAKLPVVARGRLGINLHRIDALAPRREILRDVEGEAGLPAFGQIGRGEGVVGQDGAVGQDAVGIDDDGRVLWRVVHRLAAEADEVEEGGQVVGGGGVRI